MTEHYLRAELYERVRTDPEIFEFLAAGSLDGIWYWDLESPEHEWMNERFWTTMGYDPATRQHLAAEWQDLIFPEDLESAVANFTAHCADPNHPYDQLVRYRAEDGSTVYVRCRGLAIRDADGKPVRMLGAHNDVTEVEASRRRLISQLEEVETLNRLAVGREKRMIELKQEVNAALALAGEAPRYDLGFLDRG